MLSSRTYLLIATVGLLLVTPQAWKFGFLQATAPPSVNATAEAQQVETTLDASSAAQTSDPNSGSDAETVPASADAEDTSSPTSAEVADTSSSASTEAADTSSPTSAEAADTSSLVQKADEDAGDE